MATTPSRPYRQTIALAGILIAFLAAAAIYSVHVWDELGDTPMSTSGYVALVIGVLAATAVGTGLMGLVFYSSRHGIDDEAGVGTASTPPSHDL
ncbi:MAG TPA: hypothetical protein VMB81_29925 [Candidatus Sulfotelmatobacter sp.]|nr:hypothetical protein [Candidatus Sulfotelmatobacter sp.]